MFGYEADEVMGKNISILMSETIAMNHDAYIKRYVDGGPAKVVGSGRQVQGKRKNGELFPFFLALAEIKEDGEQVFTGIARDQSQQVHITKIG
jgi:PAS domain S-box-containing protein